MSKTKTTDFAAQDRAIDHELGLDVPRVFRLVNVSTDEELGRNRMTANQAEARNAELSKMKASERWEPVLEARAKVGMRCRSCRRIIVLEGRSCWHCGDTNPLGVRELGMEEHGD